MYNVFFIPHHCSHTSPDLSLNTYQFAKSEGNGKAKDLDISKLNPAPLLHVYQYPLHPGPPRTLCLFIGGQKAKDLDFIQIDSSLCRVYSQGNRKQRTLTFQNQLSVVFRAVRLMCVKSWGSVFERPARPGLQIFQQY